MSYGDSKTYINRRVNMAKRIRRMMVETLDPATNKVVQDIDIIIPAELLQGNFVSKIGGVKHLGVLLTILSHTNSEGKAFPSQETIAKKLGMTRQTVSKIIAELLEVVIDGKHLIGREAVRVGKFDNSLYTYMADITEPKSAPRKFNNSSDVVKLFAEVYESVFGVRYAVNWRSEPALLANKKFINNYTDAEIEGMISVAVTDYMKLGGNEQWPRPTISMLSGWLGNKALAIWQESNKKVAQFEERMNRDTSAEQALAESLI